jgi:putative transposase
MRLATGIHSKRWHAFHATTGTGCVYQGRFKAFPVQTDSHFLSVCRYVERNALRAGLVPRAEAWPWSSLWQRSRNVYPVAVTEWPILPTTDWIDWVNSAPATTEVDRLRHSVARGAPYGDPVWTERSAKDLGLLFSLRGPGRPKMTPGIVLRLT